MLYSCACPGRTVGLLHHFTVFIHSRFHNYCDEMRVGVHSGGMFDFPRAGKVCGGVLTSNFASRSDRRVATVFLSTCLR